MRINKEGTATLIITALIIIIFNIVADAYFCNCEPVMYLSATISVLGLALVLNFFRHPKRPLIPNESQIISPADGKVVVIEETQETEYFKDKRLQVSIFMSVWNIHLNRFSVSGKITYSRHKKGEFLLAKNPKSSEKNERHTVVVETDDGTEIGIRQIAGVMARRIVSYAQVGLTAVQGDELGFIKFGSRVDLFLPVGTKLNVSVGDSVRGNKTIIARK
ncbi:MAG: phosphatidylserine decarboxylase family protein [Bacteroidota bacterium]|nr:phosphatidylserine decarboxylase family protein [Bacteroidota bacterium]